MRYLKVVNTVLCLLVVFNHNIEIDTKLQKVLLKICRKHVENISGFFLKIVNTFLLKQCRCNLLKKHVFGADRR